MKKLILFFLLLELFTSLCGCGREDEQKQYLENIVWESETKITCTFDGVKQYALLDLPEKTEEAPLVLMLHGAGQSPEGFREMIHFEKQANPLGYAVVYVAGATNPSDTTLPVGWNSGISSTGNRDVEFLVTLAEYLQQEYLFDKERTYAVGFSNGAFMVHRLAMEASDTFSAVASVAGKMPARIWEERNKKNKISVLQITGEKDEVIPKHSDGSAKTAIDPAMEDVMEYWANSNGLELTETVTVGPKAALEKFGSKEKTTKVWHLFVKDAHHSWYSEKINKIDATAVILDFFEEFND